MKILETTRIPRWWLTAYAPDIPRVYEVFQGFLAGLSLSFTDLAKDIEVDQSTVSRWAVGRSRPTPDQMKALLVALQSRINAIAAAAEHARRATEALEGVTHAFLETKGGGQAALQKLHRAAQRLHEALKESGREQPSQRRRMRRTRREQLSKGE